MITADILGPWHRVERIDDDGHTYIEERRVPQFLHDVSDAIPWRDVTAQVPESIPPTPGLCCWRIWGDESTLAIIAALSEYVVVRQAESEHVHIDPVSWAALVSDSRRDHEEDAFPPLPEGGWLEAGAIYQYGDGAVIVRQAHNRTEHAPEDVPALFMVYRADADAALPWVAGESVSVGTIRTYEGSTYRCIQPHVTQADWTPPATPSLWAVVVEQQPGIAEWTAGILYAVGEHVLYQGGEYVCLQAHTSQVGWTPAAVPALWRVA
jgi:hypothetical protein